MISYNQDAMKSAVEKLGQIKTSVGTIKTNMESNIASIETAIQGTHGASVKQDLSEIPVSVNSIISGIGEIETTLNHVINEYNKMGY